MNYSVSIVLSLDKLLYKKTAKQNQVTLIRRIMQRFAEFISNRGNANLISNI